MDVDLSVLEDMEDLDLSVPEDMEDVDLSVLEDMDVVDPSVLEDMDVVDPSVLEDMGEGQDEAMEHAIQSHMEKQFHDAGRAWAARLGRRYDPTEFEKITESPYIRQVLSGTKKMARKEVGRQMEQQKRLEHGRKLLSKRPKNISIFNQADALIDRIPERFRTELQGDLFRNSKMHLINKDTYIFPDSSILKKPGYIRLNEEPSSAWKLAELRRPPCFFPMRTELLKTKAEPPTKELQEANLERLGGLGKTGPLSKLQNGQWPLFFCKQMHTFEWMFAALRALQGKELHDAAGNVVEGGAWQYGLRLCPMPNILLESYFHLGNLVVLESALERQGFTGELIDVSMQEGFKPDPALASPEPFLEEQIAELVNTLFNHFRLFGDLDMQVLLSKVLDYLCPGVLETIKISK